MDVVHVHRSAPDIVLKWSGIRKVFSILNSEKKNVRGA